MMRTRLGSCVRTAQAVGTRHAARNKDLTLNSHKVEHEAKWKISRPGTNPARKNHENQGALDGDPVLETETKISAVGDRKLHQQQNRDQELKMSRSETRRDNRTQKHSSGLEVQKEK
jgi:hypothetical protein